MIAYFTDLPWGIFRWNLVVTITLSNTLMPLSQSQNGTTFLYAILTLTYSKFLAIHAGLISKMHVCSDHVLMKVSVEKYMYAEKISCLRASLAELEVVFLYLLFALLRDGLTSQLD